jgi:predicted ATPase
MIYIRSFTFPNADAEHGFFMSMQRTCYDTFYPFQVLSSKGLERIDFEPLTVVYGGNGSGKSTALNVIAEKIGADRGAVYNKTNFYPDYINKCVCEATGEAPLESKIIASDDVFDYMLNIRTLNEGLDQKREDVFQEYLDAKYARYQFNGMADYGRLKKRNKAQSVTQSRFTRSEMPGNIREYSNGESAFVYFTESIKENSLYILDEPENSLSAMRQMELAAFISDSARFYNCQFIISTHSPFLLAMRGVKIYDMDESPAIVKRWSDLPQMRLYRDFFKERDREFM